MGISLSLSIVARDIKAARTEAEGIADGDIVVDMDQWTSRGQTR